MPDSIVGALAVFVLATAIIGLWTYVWALEIRTAAEFTRLYRRVENLEKAINHAQSNTV